MGRGQAADLKEVDDRDTVRRELEQHASLLDGRDGFDHVHPGLDLQRGSACSNVGPGASDVDERGDGLPVYSMVVDPYSLGDVRLQIRLFNQGYAGGMDAGPQRVESIAIEIRSHVVCSPERRGGRAIRGGEKIRVHQNALHLQPGELDEVRSPLRCAECDDQTDVEFECVRRAQHGKQNGGERSLGADGDGVAIADACLNQ